MSDLIIDGISNAPGGVFNKVIIDGMSSISGDLTCDSMEVDGVCKINGNVRVKYMFEMDGVCNIAGDLDAEDVDFGGRMNITGNMSAEKVRVEGSLTVNRTLNAGELDLKFQGQARAKEVVGGKIRIHLRTGTGHFQAELIEGDEIDIERSRVDTIRGGRVAIGKGCAVGKVEYRDELTLHPKAVVKEKVKLD